MGGGKAEGCEASRWSKTYLFVYVIDKRGYVSNFSQIKCKVREKLQFTLFWVGAGGGKALGWTRIYLFVCLIGKRPYISNLMQIEHKVREKWQFSLFGWGRGEVKPSGGLKLTYLYTL